MYFQNGLLYKEGIFIKKDFALENKIIKFRSHEKGEKIIDLNMLIVSPGFIDVHVHTRVPGFDEKDDINHITKSLINGGFTHAIAQSNVYPKPDNIKNWLLINNCISKSIINIIQTARVTKNQKVIDIKEMSKFTQFFSDDGDSISLDEEMRKALLLAKNNDIILLLHSEDKSIKGSIYHCTLAKKLKLKSFDHRYESNNIKRDLLLNKNINAKIHFQHVSTLESIKLILNSKKNGMNVSAEITPHHLCIDNESIYNDGNYRMNPPLCSPNTREELIKIFKNNSLIIATDHAPHEKEKKNIGYKNSVNGIIGLESSFAAVWTEAQKYNIPLNVVLDSMSIRPAKLLRLNNHDIKEGLIANLTIIDPKEEWIFSNKDIYSKSKNSPFINKKFKGRVKQIIINGTHIVL